MTSSQPVQRRMLLRGAGVAGASLAGVAAAPGIASAHDHSYDHDSSEGLEGSWVIQHRDDPPGDQTVVTAVVAFASGGVFSTLDIAPETGAGLGAWASRGDRFSTHFWIGAPGETPKAHGVKIEVFVRGKLRHDRIYGTYRLTVFDAVTGARLQSGTGKFTGEKLDAWG